LNRRLSFFINVKEKNNDFPIFYGIMITFGGVPMRLLLVEDEKRMAQALCEILRLKNMKSIIMPTVRMV